MFSIIVCLVLDKDMLEQVQFMHVSMVSAIQTKGRGNTNQWIESFRVEYSQDCTSFNSLMNVYHINHVRNRLVFLRISKSLNWMLNIENIDV